MTNNKHINWFLANGFTTTLVLIAVSLSLYSFSVSKYSSKLIGKKAKTTSLVKMGPTPPDWD